MLMVWYLKAWLWLHTNWKWLIFPVGVLLFVLGKLSSRREYKVLAPESVAASKVADKAQDEAQNKILEAKKSLETDTAAITKEHAAVVAKLTAQQRADMKKLQDTPEELNSFLLDIGKNLRK